jgi:hypothetical protein
MLKGAKISGMNEKSNKNELKKAIAKAQTAAEDLVKYLHAVKQLNDEQITGAVTAAYDHKLDAFEEALKSMETKGLVNSRVFAEVVKPMTRFDDFSVLALRAGNTVDQNDLKSFEYAILKTMDKLNEL